MTRGERWLPGSPRVSPESFKSRRRLRLEEGIAKECGPASLRAPPEAELRRGCPGNFREEERATGFLGFGGDFFFATRMFCPKRPLKGMEMLGGLAVSL